MFPLIFLPILRDFYKKANPDCGGDCESILFNCENLHSECCEIHAEKCTGTAKQSEEPEPVTLPPPSNPEDFITERKPVMNPNF
jgi:hypothetical protein